MTTIPTQPVIQDEIPAPCPPSSSSNPELSTTTTVGYETFATSRRWKIDQHVGIPTRPLSSEELQLITTTQNLSQARYDTCLKAAYEAFKSDSLGTSTSFGDVSRTSLDSEPTSSPNLHDPSQPETKSKDELDTSSRVRLGKIIKEIDAFLTTNPFSLHVYSVTLTIPSLPPARHLELMKYFKRTYRPNVQDTPTSTSSIPESLSASHTDTAIETKTTHDYLLNDRTHLLQPKPFDWKQLAVIVAEDISATSELLPHSASTLRIEASYNDPSAKTSPTISQPETPSQPDTFTQYTFCYFPSLRFKDITFSPLVLRDVTVQMEGPWIEDVANQYVGMLPVHYYRSRAMRDGRLHHITLFHPLSASQALKDTLRSLRPWPDAVPPIPPQLETRYADNLLSALLQFGEDLGYPVSIHTPRIVFSQDDLHRIIPATLRPITLEADVMQVMGLGRLVLVNTKATSNSIPQTETTEPPILQPRVVQGIGEFPCKYIPKIQSSSPRLSVQPLILTPSPTLLGISQVQSIVPSSALVKTQPSGAADDIIVEAESYYVCIEWSVWTDLMQHFSVKPKLHITLGFFARDIHNGSKAAADSLILRHEAQ